MRIKVFLVLFLLSILPLNAGMNFDGLFSHVVSGTVTHGVGTGDFTWTAWVNPTTIASAYDTIMSNGSFSPAFYIRTTSTQLGAYWGGDLDSGQVLVPNEWQHVVFLKESGTIRFYVNGVQTPTTHVDSNSMADAVFYVGYDNFSGDVMTGQIDDARFYRRVLSDAEILSLAQSRTRINMTDGLVVYWRMDEGLPGLNGVGTGVVIDRSGNGNNGTPTSNPVWQASSWVNYQ